MRGHHPGNVLGYHGTSGAVAEVIVHGRGRKPLEPSTKSYDWLGRGIYFWENSQQRAEQWAEKQHPRDSAVIGAVIQLGHCLDLLDQRFIDLVGEAAKAMCGTYRKQGRTIPRNTKSGAHRFDCALIDFIRNEPPDRFGGPYDSARAAYIEGKSILGRSAFHRRTHIQIAVYNKNCIKGYFWPAEESLETSSVPLGD